MIRRCLRVSCVALALACVASTARATTIDFESLTNGTAVTNQFAGFAFSNTTVISAGISLDEFEFPPHSGTNVVFDDGGPIAISFSSLVGGFGGYVTYASPLTISAFDSSNVLLGSVSSAFSNNMRLSGEAGSSPNEFLQFTSLVGIGSIMISGDALGGSFTLDDIATTPLQGTTPVPEPGTLTLMLLGVVGVAMTLTRRDEVAGLD